MADLIQANYESLAGIARSFAQHAAKVRHVQGRLNRQMALLRPAWTGRGSEAFFAEMSDKVLPAVQRLSAALAEADRVTRQIQEILRQAEEQGATPFRPDAAHGTIGGPDMESGITPGGQVPIGGTGGPVLGDLQDGGPGMGAGETFPSVDRDGLLPNEFIGREGFGNPGDGFGDDGITWPGGSARDDFLVPEDWLAQVKETWDDGSRGGLDSGGVGGETGVIGERPGTEATDGAGGGGTGGGLGSVPAVDQATGGGAAGGEAAGAPGSLGGTGAGGGEAAAAPGSAGGTGAGTPSAAGMPFGGREPFAATDMLRGLEGSPANGNAAGSLPAPLRYQPASGIAAGTGAGGSDAQSAGGTVAAGSAPEAPVSRVNLGIPIGLAALGPLVALLGKAIRDRYAQH